jgi:glycosyltransferase involved in cell wall biosynthesis
LKILHLVSDWKWTGPAEPMLVLIQAMRARGHVVELVCPPPPEGAGRNLEQEAAARGLAPIAPIASGRSAWQRGDGAIVSQLAQWLATASIGGPFDVVHTWHTRDHVLAARALGRLPLARWRHRGRAAAASWPTQIVRFASRAEPIEPWPWNRWLFGAACDGLLCVSEASATANRRVRPSGPLAVTPAAVDLDAFSPVAEPAAAAEPDRARSFRERGEMRRAACRVLGVPPEAFLIGVVARIQGYRRFELLLAAMAELVRARPEARLVLFGRGTRADEIVDGPVRALSLEGHVVRAGYRTRDYVALLGAMDVFTFLVPGSDGTCRALREAAALGLPLVGTRRGAIPEIIRRGETGLVVDEDAVSLAKAWETLARDPARRCAMGDAARRDARLRFSPAVMAAFTERFYAELLRSAPTSSR